MEEKGKKEKGRKVREGEAGKEGEVEIKREP